MPGLMAGMHIQFGFDLPLKVCQCRKYNTMSDGYFGLVYDRHMIRHAEQKT